VNIQHVTPVVNFDEPVNLRPKTSYKQPGSFPRSSQHELNAIAKESAVLLASLQNMQ
jgi:hypothetical protein